MGRSVVVGADEVSANCVVALIADYPQLKGAISSRKVIAAPPHPGPLPEGRRRTTTLVAATTPGAAAMKILFAGRASELKRLRDILADRLLHLLHRLLRIQEI